MKILVVKKTHLYVRVTKIGMYVRVLTAILQKRNASINKRDRNARKQVYGNAYKLEMWANAQPDGRPAKYRWRPLFNAAKFGWRPLLDAVQ